MSLVINLLDDLAPGQLKPGDTICPIFSRVEPIEGGFGGSQVTVKSALFVCIGDKCGMFKRCQGITTPGATT